jgi:hypothetical protein
VQADLVGFGSQLGQSLARVHAAMSRPSCRRSWRGGGGRSRVLSFGSRILTLLNHGRECSSCRGVTELCN